MNLEPLKSIEWKLALKIEDIRFHQPGWSDTHEKDAHASAGAIEVARYILRLLRNQAKLYDDDLKLYEDFIHDLEAMG